jgi:hypothetical protein
MGKEDASNDMNLRECFGQVQRIQEGYVTFSTVTT